MSRKKKFDLTKLVHDGSLQDGQTLHFVSDPKKTCVITKTPTGEYKVAVDGPERRLVTIHAYATECLGMDPPDHAAKWLRTAEGQTLFDLWHADDMADAA